MINLLGKNYRYICVVGPTASGKSQLGLDLAERLDGEIINCDSIQVYKGFDIGAAKPSKFDYKRAAHHLFSFVHWEDDYDARAYARDARCVIEGIESRGKTPILVGGTGLYLRALWQEDFHVDLPKDETLRVILSEKSNNDLMQELARIDPKRALEIHENDRYRLLRAVELIRLLGGPVEERSEKAKSTRKEAFTIFLSPPRSLLHERINTRTSVMLNEGLIQEVKGLLSQGCKEDCKPMKAIGYKQVCEYLNQSMEAAALVPAIQAATRQYAKRQVTWFRKIHPDLVLTDCSPRSIELVFESL